MDSVDVSVVIPAFRAVDFIGCAIDSALNQDGVREEVIVVDDACPMHTGDAVKARYDMQGAIPVIRLPINKGPADARNAGFRAARGEWIAVLDADDMFDPGRPARLVIMGRRLEADVLADNVRYFDAVSGTLSKPKIKSLLVPERIDLYDLVARGRPGTGELDYGLLKPIFRRAFVETMPELYPSDVRHGEDILFYIRLIRAGARFLVTPEPGYRWTQRNSGNSQTSLNYLGQAADTRAIKGDKRVRDDTRLVRLLEERAQALVRLHHERGFHASLRDRRYGRALAAMVRHPLLASMLARTLLRR